MKKFLGLLLVPMILLVSCATTEKQTAETAAPAETETVKTTATDGTLDLSTVDYNWMNGSGTATYDAAAGFVSAKGVEAIYFPLPKELASGDSVTVEIVGKNNGKNGFRVWLVDTTQTTLSNLYTDCVGDGLATGDFDVTCTLTATGDVNTLFIKGPVYGTPIDDIEVSKVIVK